MVQAEFFDAAFVVIATDMKPYEDQSVDHITVVGAVSTLLLLLLGR